MINPRDIYDSYMSMEDIKYELTMIQTEFDEKGLDFDKNIYERLKNVKNIFSKIEGLLNDQD